MRKFLHDHVDPGVFAPDAVSTLIAAFDGAWQSSRGFTRVCRIFAEGSYVSHILPHAASGQVVRRRLRVCGTNNLERRWLS